MLLVGLCVRIAFGDDPEERRFSLDELEALGQKGYWDQVLFHAQHVPSGERGPRWEVLVERSTVQNLNFLREGAVSGADQLAISFAQNFPFLTRSKVFRESRDEAALAEFRRLYGLGTQSTSESTEALVSFAKQIGDDTDFAFRAGQLAAEKQDPVAALPLYHLAIMGSVGTVKKGYCDHAEIKRSVTAALHLASGDLTRKALQIADKECWTAMQTDLATAFQREPSSAFDANVCPLFSAHKKEYGAPPKRCALNPSGSQIE